MSRRPLLLIVVAAALVLASACAGTAGVGPVPAVGPSPNVDPLTGPLPAPALRWGPCPAVPDPAVPRDTPGLSCAVATLPLDYTNPTGRMIDVTVSRLSTGPDRPILMSNPGGPGAPGLFNPSMWDGPTGGRLAQHYDLIGFDPRGVGLSTPVDCRLPQPLVTFASGGGSVPTTLQRDADDSRRVAAACGATIGDLAPYLTTLNTARDLDMIRKALGRDRVTVLGMSYGTELAVTFASLFPGSTDRVLLDSAQDVTQPWRGASAQTAPVVQGRFDEIARVLASRDAEYHLGTTPEAVQSTYLRAADRLGREPVRIGPDVLTPSSLDMSVRMPAVVDDSAVDLIGWGVGYVARVPGGPTEEQMIRLGPDADDASTGPMNGQTLSQSVSIYWSIRCGDDTWPRDLATYRDGVAAEAARTPVTRGKWSNVNPCAYWPNPPREPRIAVTDRGWQGGPNVLILQNTGDYRAVPVGVEHLRSALGARAVTVTAGGRAHGVFWENGCARERALDWIVDGELPGPEARRC